MSDFKRIQLQWAAWLREPGSAAPPEAEQRRLAVYQRLVRNNIDGFIARGFPVLKSVLSEQYWQLLVDDFIAKHRAKSPLFAEIGTEFVTFIANYDASWLPPFSYQLAVYERMELDAYHYSETCRAAPASRAIEELTWRVNPSLTWHAFDYPVHTIAADNVPHEPLETPVFLAVYRVDEDEERHFSSRVKFMQLNPVTMLLVDYLQQHPSQSLAEIAEALAQQLPQFNQSQLYQGLVNTVPDLYQRAMLFPSAN
ncbi:DNA-binding domain-containing protein [Pseudidiomarina sp.]|uniref:HvfC family RiPP maturation protein n=1 Tax=Pseudidiomarina sp. TaxID=2081707 RepID=UPI003A986750